MNNTDQYYNSAASPIRQQSPATVSPLATQPSPQMGALGARQKRQYPRMEPSPQPQGYPQQPVQSYPQSQYEQPAPQQYQQAPQQFQQQQQFQPQVPQAPIHRYASPVPSQTSYGGYNQALNGMANINLQQRQDISLVGQPPLIQDLHTEATPKATIPPQITATNSPHVQVNPCFNHATVNKFPYSNSLLKKSKLPLALILQPYLSSKVEKIEVPVVEDTVVSRCSRCKTYINPFIQFTAGALQWKCNMCGMENDVPQAFDYDIVNGQPVDRYARAELNYGCVDFVAPAEYTIRPPQPPVYVFVIDTSFQSVQTGMVSIVADAIKASLDKIPNQDGRTKIAFISADNAVGFHKLSQGEAEILVVGDLQDMYLPRASSDLIVNLNECRAAVEDLLDKMKMMYQGTHASINCLGSALQAARKLLSPTGGKIVCFQASLPSIGDGVIKSKTENTNALDSPLMTASNNFYKTFAGECTKSQVCADMFLFGDTRQISDVATLNVLPRFTGGQTHFYPGFHASKDGLKLKQEVIALLSEEIGLEAVMKTRCSQGIVCRAFYGNCTTRIPDIMALPNVPRDQSYCIELGIEQEIESNFCYFQTALLYTTCFGERRIRVMNLCLPVTKSISKLYASVDQTAIARTVCHQAIDKGANSKLRDGRDHLSKQVIDICGAYSKEVLGASNGQVTVCKQLCLLPLLILSILKSQAFHDSSVPMDHRAQSAILLRTLPTESWLEMIHPNFYSIHNLPQLAGIVDIDTNKVIMPPKVNLSSEKLEAHGCYMLENGQDIYLWIGKQAVPQLCKDLLGVSSINEVKSGQISMLPNIKSPISERVNNLIYHLQTDRQVTYYPSIYIIKEDGDPMLRSRFLNHLVEDRQPTGPTTAGAIQQHVSSGMSYFQWLGYIRSKIQ